ncbi:MAG: T9SS type A sorting domain-containing protein [Saprospiraceae bacterium]|nr:T9SS type A sorting domain-containing protein [Candidatus Defluviibacterium haderslevense]
MKIIASILFSFVFAKILLGQGIFNKYQYDNYWNPTFTGINTYKNQIWTFGSLTRTTDHVNDLMVSQLDNKGNLLEFNVLKDDSTYHWFNVGMERINNDLYTITNEPYISSCLVKYNTISSSFEKLATYKSKEKENTFYTCHDFIKFGNEHFIMSSVDNSKLINNGLSSIQISKISTSGIKLWEFQYKINYFSCYPTKIRILKDSQLIISCVGNKDAEFNQNDRKSIISFFIHLTKDGKLIKIVTAHKVYANINDFVYQSDGSYICAGADTVHISLKNWYAVCPIIFKLDSLGYEIWSKDISDRKISSPGLEQMDYVEYDSASELFVSAGIGKYLNDYGPQKRIRLLSCIGFNNNGDIVWNRVLKNNIGQLQDICFGMELLNGNVWVVGITGIFDEEINNYYNSAVLIKLNMDGCVEENCIDTKIDTSMLRFTFGPNPINNEMIVYSNEFDDINFKIYSLEGKLKLTYLIPPFSYHRSISTTELDNGIYIIEAINTKTNRRFIDKLIVQNQ